MTRSMTAFARQEAQHEWGSLIWEVRSVNHRYLEPHLRLPESLRDIEGPLREALRKKLSRGKIECTLRFVAEAQSQTLTVNETFARELLDAAQQMENLLQVSKPIDTMDLLRWPGVLQDTSLDMDAVKKAALSLFHTALDELIESRAREGVELAALIDQRLDTITEIVVDVRNKLPGILQAQRDNLKARLEEFKADLDQNRVEQEMVILAQKADVDEEMDRLNTHVQEVKRVLKSKGPIGRRLDFLMQELNREANTLSSKSIVTDTTQSAVELKVLIEQMREQIQNIE
ncbi:YicC/YloC family endoribonuclease [Amphritea sp. 2_MG-2023]|uniref:YicC/YloC family endoribonuclease n=1 Tax=Amphritea TaxID=515417 RepID=UPI001C077F5C|nr:MULTISPECIES: YicC/YloC family endoribonuclease [Amphritea]MBU2967044.1 YicC family protein [Amphritea atlantica]MDO6419402.1 YicC/YloC family endoribonuclease [Amphritea sp. 2_MG-2023]